MRTRRIINLKYQYTGTIFEKKKKPVVAFIIKLSVLPKLSSINFQEISKDTEKQEQGISNKHIMYPFSGSYKHLSPQSIDLTFRQIFF